MSLREAEARHPETAGELHVSDIVRESHVGCSVGLCLFPTN